MRRDFHDKLAPAERWLASQVGRPWSKVFSEVDAQDILRCGRWYRRSFGKARTAVGGRGRSHFFTW